MDGTGTTYLLRLWLPDRPGALAAVAARLGGLKGDVVGLDIVERRCGLAVDELVVSFPPGVPVDLIADEVGQVDDVDIEDLRVLGGSTYDPQLDGLELAALLVGAETVDDLAEALCDHLGRAVLTGWACVVERDGHVLAGTGERPNDRWLEGFVSATPAADSPARMPDLDVVWLPLPAASAALVVGRDIPFRDRERRRLAALARLADTWFRRLRQRADQQARMLHPSRP